VRVEAENPDMTEVVHRIAAILQENGGFVAPDFIVREQDGEFSCAIGDQPGQGGRILVSYPRTLTVPMYQLEWSDSEDQLEPIAGLDGLSTAHRALLEQWLLLVNGAGKLPHVRQVLPQLAVTDWPLRHHLAAAGYPDMREVQQTTDAKESFLAWHSSGGGSSQSEPDAKPQWRLIPLKHLVNHHPAGADQNPLPRRTAVATSATSSEIETFENYGDLDALQLLMGFGYVDSAAPLVHSVPVEVEASAFGRVVVKWRAPRYPRGEAESGAANLRRDIPIINGGPDGVELRHLTFRPDNRPRVAALLAMAIQSRTGLAAPAANQESEAILDAIAQANLAYYRQLDELVVTAAEGDATRIIGMLAEVSMLQQHRLSSMWG
jgi:hypothetical protein